MNYIFNNFSLCCTLERRKKQNSVSENNGYGGNFLIELLISVPLALTTATSSYTGTEGIKCAPKFLPSAIMNIIIKRDYGDLTGWNWQRSLSLRPSYAPFKTINWVSFINSAAFFRNI